MTPFKTLPALLSFSLALAFMLPCASGALLVEDHFLTGSNSASGEYTVGAAIGQGPTTLGYSGVYLDAGFTAPNIITTGLNYSDGTRTLSTAGGAFQSPTTAQHTRAGRLLQSPFTSSSTGTFYLSFLYQISAVGTNRAVELHNGGFNDNTHRTLQIGSIGSDGLNAANFGLRINNNSSLRLDLGTALNTGVNLFVLKFELSNVVGGDSVTVYLNPQLNAEPSSGLSLSGFDLQFDRTSIAKFNGSSVSLTMDELRIANSYLEAVPSAIPEPSAFALIAGLASVIGCAFSRRRS